MLCAYAVDVEFPPPHTQPFYGSMDFVRDNPGQPGTKRNIQVLDKGNPSIVSSGLKNENESRDLDNSSSH